MAQTIEIPLNRNAGHGTGAPGEDVLEVDLNELRGNDDAIINILKQEQSHLSFFLEFAFQYYKRGMVQEFEHFLHAGWEAGKTPAYDVYTEKDVYILILNALAAHHVETARREPAADVREQLFTIATQVLNDAEPLDRFNVFTILIKATVMLARRQYDQALYTFRGALQLKPGFVPAHIGVACTLFQRRDYKAALSEYQVILRLRPDFQPDVRVPIGICFHRLGMETEARAAFTRALALNSQNIDAIVLLMLMDFNKSRKQNLHSQIEQEAAVASANKLLMQAYKINNKNPIVATQMSLRFLQKNAMDKARPFAEAAVRHSFCDAARADALAAKARIAQTLGDYDAAFALYSETVALETTAAAAVAVCASTTTSAAVSSAANPPLDQVSPSVLFGLAQMQIYKNKDTDAMSTLDRLLQKEPENYEALFTSACVHARAADKADRATELFERLKKLHRLYQEEDASVGSASASQIWQGDSCVSDPELLIEMGMFFERKDLKRARDAYELAMAIFKSVQDTGMSMTPELVNNLAVLYHVDGIETTQKLGKQAAAEKSAVAKANDVLQDTPEELFGRARELYQNAQEAMESAAVDAEMSEDGPSALERFDMIRTAISYNLARLDEASGQVDLAVEQYNEILKEHPAHVDSILRLACVSIDNKDTRRAFEFLSNALAISEANTEAWALVAKAHGMDKAFRAARKSYEKILQEIDKYDTYALCNTGNMCLRFARSDHKQREIHCKRAVEFFNKALRQEPRNVYAATGIAIAFAELGRLNEASELLTQIQGVAVGNLNVTINLAHVFVEVGLPQSAIPLYERAKRCMTNDMDVIRSLARAHYIIGKTNKIPESMLLVAECISEAMKLNPNDLSLKYNYALALQQYAQVLNDQPKEGRPLSALRSASTGLQESERLFDELSKCEQPQLYGFDTKRARERANYSRGVRRVTDKNIHATEVLERQRETRLAEIRAKREEIAETRRIEEERRKQQEADAEAELERKRLQLRERVQEDNERMKMELEEDKTKPSRRKAANTDGEIISDEEDDAHHDGNLYNADDVDHSVGESRKRFKAKRKRKHDERNDTGNGSDDAADGNDEAMMLKRAKNLGVKSKLSSAIIESDDEDDTNE